MRTYFEKPQTTESQVHRQLTSGLPCPVGFKNGHDGHLYAVESSGNADCHIILRGGQEPNYSPSHIQAASKALYHAKLPVSIMVDCSHGNSQKRHKNQLVVAQSLCEQSLCEQLSQGEQSISANMTYGQSVTDACINWSYTKILLSQFAAAVATRRALYQSISPITMYG